MRLYLIKYYKIIIMKTRNENFWKNENDENFGL